MLKQFLSLLFTAICYGSLFAQVTTPMPDQNASRWKTIDSLDQQGLYRSALTETESLLTRVRSQNLADQTVRALIYRAKFNRELNESGDALAIRQLETEMATADFPEKPILQSFLAEAYHTYLQRNRWQIEQRTSLAAGPDTTIENWAVADFIDRATELYLASVSDTRTRQVPLTDIKAVVKLTDKTDKRPTLYDLLVFRAIAYFETGEATLTVAAYTFAIDQAAFFAPAETFVQANFETTDATSSLYRIVRLYQELLAYRLQHNNIEARVDADLHRLAFLYQQSNDEKRFDWYQRGLENLRNRYQGQPVEADIMLALARYFYERGFAYGDQQNTDRQFDWRFAHGLLIELRGRYPQSEAATASAELRKQINTRNINTQVEQVYLPQQPGLFYVGYRNVATVHWRIVRVDGLESFRQDQEEERLQRLRKSQTVSAGTQNVTQVGDFREHGTELYFDALPLGFYAIMLSDNTEFADENGLIAYQFFTVSRLGPLVVTEPQDQSNEVLVTDRETGAPLPGVVVEVVANPDNRQGRRRVLSTTRTNGQGRADVEPGRDRYGQLHLRFGQDELYTNDAIYGMSRNRRQRPRQATEFFLDRGIYRPGQTLYYKALLLEYDPQNYPRVLANTPVTITLRDVNGQPVGEQELRSNEFGTVQGTFILPSEGLTGSMQLLSNVGGNGQGVQVEEYKRPRFLVEMDELPGRPKLGETVTVTGTAAAYAGPALQDATVRYRITRRNFMPWWYSRYYPQSGGILPVASGTVQTDDDGAFSIDFTALPPDKHGNGRRWYPTYQYVVEVDVTDITGETRSAIKRFVLNESGIQLNVDAPRYQDRGGSLQLQLSAKNADGNTIPVAATLRAIRLDHPARVFVKRYWKQPDQPIIPEAEFERKFPNFAYAEEDQIINWQESEEVFQQRLGNVNDSLLLGIGDWPTGVYRLVATTEDGATAETYITIYDKAANIAPVGEIFWAQAPQRAYQPGETATIEMATVAGSVVAATRFNNRTESRVDSWLNISPWQTFALNIEEDDRGGLFGKATVVRFNRVYSQDFQIPVPWDNKKLRISYGTFRDKLRPGEPEEWQLTISGPDGEGLTAELVAAMYDASLDQLYPYQWNFAPYPQHYQLTRWSQQTFSARFGWNNSRRPGRATPPVPYPTLLTFDFFNAYPRGRFLAMSRVQEESMEMEGDAVMLQAAAPPPMPAGAVQEEMANVSDEAAEEYSAKEAATAAPAAAEIVPRKNLQETAFFFPQLKTDRLGRTVLSFTSPEALTKWKVQLFGHTPELAYVLDTREVITQKELMVLPNAPRFLREGDRIFFTAKVSNTSATNLTGNAKLELFSALDMQPIDEAYGSEQAEQIFTLAPGASQNVSWELSVPDGAAGAIVYRIMARAGNFSDGEENALPVLTNKTMLTAALPLHMQPRSMQTFTLDPLARMHTTDQPQRVTLEVTSNPAWLAVKSLPYLMEYPYNCTEQLVNRFYANSLATEVVRAYPKMRDVFDRWRANGQSLQSPLTLNQELSGIVLEETPWVRDAQSEAEQRQRIAVLFDLDRMANEQQQALTDLVNRQQQNGSFSWFPGGNSSWYITQYVLESLYHLRELNATSWSDNDGVSLMTLNALKYVNRQAKDYYDELLKDFAAEDKQRDENHLTSMLIHYLYVTSFVQDQQAFAGMAEMRLFYLDQADKYWLDRGLYEQGMLALALHRSGRAASAGAIFRSLRERALQSEELGMYWKYPRGYYWHQLPIETHTMLLEVFNELGGTPEEIDQLKVWLLKNKETNRWETTKATAAAVYGLLNTGENWLGESQLVQVTFPEADKSLYAARLAQAENSAEAGTGYYRTQWAADEITPALGTVKVRNRNKTIAWGGLYYQYLRDIDKVERYDGTPLKIERQILRRDVDDRGETLTEIKSGADLEPGQRLSVRLLVSTDRDMEYVHLKDLRASGLEPTETLSGYRYQDALGYYRSITDIGMHYFFDYLPKGNYVLEYDLFVNHRGDFSNGVATLQCMYAPKFSAYSAGSRLQVGK